MERKPKDVIEAIEAFNRMSPHDRSRLFQCITCRRDSSACGKTDEDEDEKGFCKFYLGGLGYKA